MQEHDTPVAAVDIGDDDDTLVDAFIPSGRTAMLQEEEVEVEVQSHSSGVAAVASSDAATDVDDEEDDEDVEADHATSVGRAVMREAERCEAEQQQPATAAENEDDLDEEDPSTLAPTILPSTVEGCLESVVDALRADAAVAARRPLPDGIPITSLKPPRSVHTVLTEKEVYGSKWTHFTLHPTNVREPVLLLHSPPLAPDGSRFCVLEAEDARDLYVGCSYADLGMGIMERIVSSESRLSLKVNFTTYCRTEQDEAERLAHLLDHVTRILLRDLQVERIRVGCIVLRHPCLAPGIDPQCYILHWPAITMHRTELTRDWVESLLGPAEEDGDGIPYDPVARLECRNTRNYVPMYGCREDEKGPLAPLAWAFYDPTRGMGPPGDVPAALLRWVQDGAVAWVGNGLRLPSRPNATVMLRALPLLCSINPMGTPPCRRRRRSLDGGDWEGCLLRLLSSSEAAAGDGNNQTAPPTAADERRRAMLELVAEALRLLSPTRRRSPAQQNQVGEVVHCLTEGGQRGLCLWISWVYGWEPPKDMYHEVFREFLDQWQQFGMHSVGRGGYDGLSRLYSMVETDASHEEHEAFLNGVCKRLHQVRKHSNATVGVMGSLTHLDLARYILQRVQNKVVCSSTTGRGLWYRFDPDSHRWFFDRDGPGVLIMCHRILESYLETLRTQYAAEEPPPPREPSSTTTTTGGGGRQQATGGEAAAAAKPGNNRQPLSFMVNFDREVTDALSLQRAIIMHLDSALGDMRSMQSILRALSVQIHREDFAQRLDVEHETLIPFANGVLDMEYGILRPGRPEDMVMRGPDYAWIDVCAGDPDVASVEAMLTTMFPDRTVRDFIVTLGASLLRKRNRFKHFYVLTGSTNGGKSFFLSLLKRGLGPLYGVLPMAAITGRTNDPSSHTDYLARTQGFCMCVVNEPDSATQQIYPDAVKALTADQDHLNVRELYGHSREMMVSWKLFMACNTPPTFANVDSAVVARNQYIPFETTFTDTPPTNQRAQFETLQFKADRNMDDRRIARYARVLMCMFFARYMHARMYVSTYNMEIPQRIRMEGLTHLNEVFTFRAWCRAFMRPASVIRGESISRDMHERMSVAMETLVTAARQWDEAHPHLVSLPWHKLPKDVQMDLETVGSPGWVRCQSVDMLRTQFLHIHEQSVLTDTNIIRSFQSPGGVSVPVICPFVSVHVVMDAFHRYRRSNRHNTVRPVNRSNTMTTPSSRVATAGADDGADGGAAADFGGDGAGDQADGGGGGASAPSAAVGVNMRMHLDVGLVRSIMREVVEREPYGSIFLGICLVENRKVYTDNYHITFGSLNRATQYLVDRWYARYMVAMPYHSMVDASMLQTAIRLTNLSDVRRTQELHRMVTELSVTLPHHHRPDRNQQQSQAAAVVPNIDDDLPMPLPVDVKALLREQERYLGGDGDQREEEKAEEQVTEEQQPDDDDEDDDSDTCAKGDDDRHSSEQRRRQPPSSRSTKRPKTTDLDRQQHRMLSAVDDIDTYILTFFNLFWVDFRAPMVRESSIHCG